MTFLYLLAVIRGIMIDVKPHRWDLDSAALVPGEEVRVFLEDTDDTPSAVC